MLRRENVPRTTPWRTAPNGWTGPNPADLLIRLYDYHGTLSGGYINSVFGQKGCLKTTEGYNYMAMEDDVWVYTGVTSVSGDRSQCGICSDESADQGDPVL